MKEFKYKQRGYSNFQPLAVHECIEIPRGVGVDINYQRVAGGLSSYLKSIQFAPRPRIESNSIDFSQSLTQILASLGHNLNTNLKQFRDSSPQIREMNQDQRSPTSNPASRERNRQEGN